MAGREEASDGPQLPDRFIHDKSGGVLMRCPSCHRERYVSEHLVFVRKEVVDCPACGTAHAHLEPVFDSRDESVANRLRPRSEDTTSLMTKNRQPK